MLKSLGKAALLLCVLTTVTLKADVIDGIKIRGNKRVSEEAILYRIKSEAGKEVDKDTVSEDIKRLWELEVFADIRADLLEEEGKHILVFTVLERPIIKDYSFLGNHVYGPNLLEDKLKEKGIALRKNVQVDYKQISKIIDTLRELYGEKGYHNVDITYRVENMSGNAALLSFRIIEGSKMHIYEIKFTGNDALSDRKIKRSMEKLKEKGFLTFFSSKDVYSEEKFDEDIDNIKKAYWKKGYKDIFVGRPIMKVEDHTSDRQKEKNENRILRNKKVKEDIRVYITIPLFEGDQYTINQVSFTDNKLITDASLLNYWEMDPGDPFDLGIIGEFETEISDIYNNQGYIQFSMERLLDVKDDKSVDLTFKLMENKQFRVNRIEFQGNVVTRDKVLRREVMLTEGSPFRVETFKNSLLKINQLGFFDVTKGDPDIDFIGDDKVDILIKGEESGVNEINFGGGYSEYAGFFIQSSYATRNFLGRGENLQISANIGSRINNYNIAFTEPWVFDYPHSFSFNIFKSEIDYYNYQRNSAGFSLGFGFRLTPFMTYGIQYKYELVDVPGSSLYNSSVFEPVQDRLTSSIVQSITYNTLNHPFMPTRGHKMSLSFEYAGWELGGDNLKYQAMLKTSNLFPAIKTTFFAIHTKWGYQDAIGKGVSETSIPYYDRYFIGGESSVRGYDYRRIAPTDPEFPTETIGGTKMFSANFEWVLPIETKFQFALFFDMGAVWLEDEGFFDSNQTLHKSYGIEARFNLPIFQLPIRLTYGYPLDPVYGQTKSGNLEFTIGTIF